MNRKLGVMVAAILLPGGLIALVGAFVLKRLSQTSRGQKVLQFARDKAPGWAANLKVPALVGRQAA
ncbi:MAG TPA: hypothetical protein VGH20_17420 [Myxococcales bacterium]